MIPLPPKVKLVLGIIIAGLLAAGGYWTKTLHDLGLTIPAWLPPIVAVLTFVEGYLTVPAGVAAKLAGLLKTNATLTSKLGGTPLTSLLLIAGLTGLFGVTTQGCKGVNFPSLDAVEQVVLTDLETCGTSTVCLEKMDADVAKLFNDPTVSFVDAIINDAVTFLIDAGLIPANILGEAKHLQGVKRLKLVSEMPAHDVARTAGF